MAFICATMIVGSAGHSWPGEATVWDCTGEATVWDCTGPVPVSAFCADILLAFFLTSHKMSQLFEVPAGDITSEDQRRMDAVQESRWERRMNNIKREKQNTGPDIATGPTVSMLDIVTIPDTLEVIREGLSRIKDRSYQKPQKESYALTPPEGGLPSEPSGLCSTKYGFCRPLKSILEDIADIIKEISESPSKSELIRRTMASRPPPAYRPPPSIEPDQGRVKRNEYREPQYSYTEEYNPYDNATNTDQMGGYMCQEQQDNVLEPATQNEGHDTEIKVIEIDTSSTHNIV